MRTLKTATGFYAEAAKINKHTKPNKTLLVKNSYSHPCLVKENPDKGSSSPMIMSQMADGASAL